MITPKQRHFNKVYREAKYILCACGCGKKMKEFDRYARRREYVSGHNGRKYQDKGQHKREWNHRNREARYQYKMALHRKNKVKTIALGGGKCKDCGMKYDGKNASIFHFHHLDASKKLFAVGNNVVNFSWKRICAEIKKCIMICANCHEMRHSSEF